MKKTIAGVLVFIVLAALMVLPMASCTKQEVVNVYNWGEYIAPGVIVEFEKETGIKVRYSTFDSNEIMYSKLKGGSGSYDVIFPSDYMAERLRKAGMLAELDLTQIPNISLIDSAYKGLPYDPEDKYTVPYMWGTVGIVYNKEKVTDPIDSWDVLWDEKYAKQIMMYDSSRDAIAVALIKAGYDPNERSEEALAKAEELLKEQKKLLLCYALDDSVDKMLAGEAAMAVVYSGQALLIMGDEQNGDKFDYVVPKEGSNIWVDAMAVPADAPNKDNAMKFIDFMCHTDIALRNVEEICYSTPHTGALAQMDEADRTNTVAYPDAETVARCKVYSDLAEYTGAFEDAWTRVKAN